jgi:hypothetical protein
MRPASILHLFVIMSAAAAGGCSDTGAPRPGEVVTPQLVLPETWKAGRTADIAVRLQAQNASSTRSLGFNGIPENSHPLATVTFYRGEVADTPLELALSHRC